MKLFYAAGGGLGHLSRGWALAHQWGWKKEDVRFVYAPHPARDFDWVLKAGPTSFEAVHIPYETNVRSNRKDLQAWLIGQIGQYGIDEIYLDCFPSGLIGEWKTFPSKGLRFSLIARNLKADAYGSLFDEHPRFEKVIQVEAFSPEYQDRIEKMNARVLSIDLQYPEVGGFEEIIKRILALPRPRWMIVHSGPVDELMALYDMARDDARKEGQQPHIFLVNTHSDPIAGVSSYRFFPAYPIFRYVDRLYTGGGFNLMKQAEAFRRIHRVLPFVRKYDDQFFRLKNSQSGLVGE